MPRPDDSGGAPADLARALDFDARGPTESSLSAAPIHGQLEGPGQGVKRGVA